MKHNLKIYTQHFRDVQSGRKKAEVRIDDRNFKVGDVLVLKEFEPKLWLYQKGFSGRYTGRVCIRWITHILKLQGYYEEMGLSTVRISKDNCDRPAIEVCVLSLGKLPKGVRL